MVTVNVLPASTNLAKIQILVDGQVMATIDAAIMFNRIVVKTEMFDGCSHEFVKSESEMGVIVP